jgi:hypothetical protein
MTTTTTTVPADMSPTDVELHAEIHRIVDRVVRDTRARYGAVTSVGSTEWWSAPDDVKLAALLIAGEAHLVSDPHEIAAEMIKGVSADLSQADDWTAASHRPSYAELVRRRNVPGPRYQPEHPGGRVAVDWATGNPVETGASEEAAA